MFKFLFWLETKLKPLCGKVILFIGRISYKVKNSKEQTDYKKPLILRPNLSS